MFDEDKDENHNAEIGCSQKVGVYLCQIEATEVEICNEGPIWSNIMRNIYIYKL